MGRELEQINKELSDIFRDHSEFLLQIGEKIEKIEKRIKDIDFTVNKFIKKYLEVITNKDKYKNVLTKYGERIDDPHSDFFYFFAITDAVYSPDVQDIEDLSYFELISEIQNVHTVNKIVYSFGFEENFYIDLGIIKYHNREYYILLINNMPYTYKYKKEVKVGNMDCFVSFTALFAREGTRDEGFGFLNSNLSRVLKRNLPKPEDYKSEIFVSYKPFEKAKNLLGLLNRTLREVKKEDGLKIKSLNALLREELENLKEYHKLLNIAYEKFSQMLIKSD